MRSRSFTNIGLKKQPSMLKEPTKFSEPKKFEVKRIGISAQGQNQRPVTPSQAVSSTFEPSARPKSSQITMSQQKQ